MVILLDLTALYGDWCWFYGIYRYNQKKSHPPNVQMDGDLTRKGRYDNTWRSFMGF